tara:strand:+ start:80 stop:1126 length:1047 start_codon:yes stop_codon:yes gene_type:complete
MIGPGIPLKLAYDFLEGPSGEEIAETYETYGGGLESLRNPDFYQDMGRFGVNTVADVARFYGNVLKDSAQSSGNYLLNTDLYNPFSEEGMERNTLIPGVDFPDVLTPHARYSIDAMISDKFGTPTIITDNPYAAEDSALKKNIENKAEAESTSYLESIIPDEDKDGYADDIVAATDKKMPNYSMWAVENQGSSSQEWIDMWNNTYENEWMNNYGKKFNNVFDNSVKSQMFSDFGIRQDENFINPKGSLSGFDAENYYGPGSGYAREGEPLLEYETSKPEAYYKMGTVAEVPADIIGGGIAYKQLMKQTPRLAKKIFSNRKTSEGIMGNRERIEGPRFDFAEEYFRNRR